MRNRIMQIMKSKGMSQQEFSRATGISPASLSSIFNGRTAPTMKHAEAMHRFFPQLNMVWLLFGEGEMFEGSEGETPDTGASAVSSENGLPGASLDLAQGDAEEGNMGIQDGGTTQGAPSAVGAAYRRGEVPYPAHHDPVQGRMETEGAYPYPGSQGAPMYTQNVRAREDNSYPYGFPSPVDSVNYIDRKKRKIVEIRIFFDDGTFETFQGNS